MDADRTELNDFAAAQPEKLKGLVVAEPGGSPRITLACSLGR